MNIWEFLKSKHFFRQLIIAAALSVAIIWGALKLLDLYTLHGHSIEVPDLEGHTLKEMDSILTSHRLRYVINDSIFDSERTKGSIAWQDPAAGTEVKRNRTIYLTMVAVLPEMTPMPNLIDLSRRQAIALLQTHGLTVGRLEYRPDIARNAVLQQKYNEGAIEPGTLVEKGTAIDLVLGEGLGDHIATVPMVIGMSRDEAIRTLNMSSLNVGDEVYMDETDVNIRVYMQKPDPIEQPRYLQAGSAVDLFYRSADLFDFEEYQEQLLSVPLPFLTGLSPEEVRVVLEGAELELGVETFEEGVTQFNASVYRQDPAYQEGKIVPRGQVIHVWYHPAEEENHER